MPAVSVIVPTYNYARFIGACLKSIFAQTYQDFEVIVVDDGSTDDTMKVLECYRREIHYIYQENRGLAAARNTGIKASKGEFLAFLDSDDLWLPEKLAEQIKVIERDPEMGLIFSDASAFNEQGILKKSILKEEKICTGFCFPRLFMGNYLVMPTVVLRKSCLEKSGLFDESLTAAEDYDLWLRISCFFKIGFVNKILASYRVHPDNMSRDFCRLLDNEIKVIEKIMERHPEKIKELGQKVSLRRWSLFNQYALELMEKDRIEIAKRYFFKALLSRPLNIRPYYYLLASMLGKRGFAKLREYKRSWLRLNQ